MDKVAIVGCGGSGKSHLARSLHVRLDAPVTHLDALYYDDQWNTLPPERFAAQQLELVAVERWVIDGNYASTLPLRLAVADTVILIDLSAATCLWGILQRRLHHGRGQHDAIGVYNRITVGFVRYILRYRRAMRPRVPHCANSTREAPRSSCSKPTRGPPPHRHDTVPAAARRSRGLTRHRRLPR